MEARHVVDDIHVLSSYEGPTAFGYLPVNAYLISGTEPVLIDTGVSREREPLLQELAHLVPLEDLRWVLVSHEDLDHSGNLEALMEAAPQARLVMNFMGFIKMAAAWRIDPQRVLLVNPGQTFTAGGRHFRVLRPPAFDSSASVGFLDEQTGALFSVDTFGGLVPDTGGDPRRFGDQYWAGITLFTQSNSPWLPLVDPARFGEAVRGVRELAPAWVMPTHGAPSEGRSEELCDHLETVPSAAPFAVPDDAAFREMLAQATGPRTAGA